MTSTGVRLPPYNNDAEQHVLGACFKSSHAFSKALEVLDAEDFYKTAHQKIFAGMRELFEENEAIDILVLADKLRKKNELDAVGGVDYLDVLEETVPTAEAVTFHAKIVHEKKLLRSLIEASTEIASDSYAEFEKVETILDRAEQSIFQISDKQVKPGFARMDDVVKQSFAQIEKLFEKPGMVTGVATGFKDLDNLTAGLHPGDLFIVAARPGMGKTSFAMDIARHAAIHEKVPTAVFSLEMSKEQLGIRMLCSEGRVNSSKLRTGFLSKSDWPNLTAAAGRLSEAPILIDDSASMNILGLRTRSRRARKDHKIGLIIVDYLQLLSVSSKAENRQLEVTEIARGLKALAKELSLPVIALSQLSRAVENRADRRPQLADLRESGSIEQEADVVAFIYRGEVYRNMDDTKQAGNDAEEGVAEILVRKQRNGPIGDVKLAFIGEYTRFENLDTQHGDQISAAAIGDAPF